MLSEPVPKEIRDKEIIIDLSYLAHRSYHASGDVVPAVMTTVGRLEDELRPKSVSFAIEGGRGHRNELYPLYKNRDPKPPELVKQIDDLIRHLIINGYQVLRSNRFEADDVMATMAYRLGRDGVIVTADKDMMQMIGICHMYHPYDRVDVTAATVLEKWGIRTDQVGDLLAIWGDKADNIPGVPKVGPVIASKLLGEFNDLTGILKESKTTESKLKYWQNIRDHEDQAILSRKLTQLVVDVPIEKVTAWQSS